MSDHAFIERLSSLVHPVAMQPGSAADDYRPIVQSARTAQLVLIGDGSHGTHEFFRERAKLTRLLIELDGFRALAIEWDWPDVRELNRLLHTCAPSAPTSGGEYWRARSPGTATACWTAAEELRHGFGGRFPDFMWRTEEFASFLRWLAQFNAQQRQRGQPENQVQLFGLDMYSLRPSTERLLQDLMADGFDRETITRAERALACLRTDDGTDNRNPAVDAACARTVQQGLPPVQQSLLQHLRTRSTYMSGTGTPLQLQQAQRGQDGGSVIADGVADLDDDADDAFFNALVVKDMTDYSRTDLQRSDAWHWNKRDTHMANVSDWLLQLLQPGWWTGNRQLQRHQAVAAAGRPPRAAIRQAPSLIDSRDKLIVWAHNSHLWNADATSQRNTVPEATLSVGQVLRERHGDRLLSVGFLTYEGTVSGADKWNGRVYAKRVPPAQPDSYEHLFHQIARRLRVPGFVLNLRDPRVRRLFQEFAPERSERAIGAVYHPDAEVERQQHYLQVQLLDQFDYVIFVDQTSASHLLDEQSTR